MSTFVVLEDPGKNKPSFNKCKVQKVSEIPVRKPEKRICRLPLQSLNHADAPPESKRPRLNEPVKKKDLQSTGIEKIDEEQSEIAKLADEFAELPKLDEEERIELVEVNSIKLLNSVEYKDDIWNYLTSLEQRDKAKAINYKYMLKQPDLNWNFRTLLVDWLAGVADAYKLCNQTLHLSVNFIDRFLSQMAVVRTKLQLVGAAAMLLAGKVEEISPIEVKEWVYLAGDIYTPRQIVKMEKLLTKVLGFNFHPSTMHTFIEHFCTEHNLDAETLHLAMYISELVLLEGDHYLRYVPSKLAAACIFLARYTLNKEKPWPKKFKEHCGYSIDQLSPVVQKQQKTFLDSPKKEPQEIQTKYKKERYHRVALLTPRKLMLEELKDQD